MEDSDRIFSVAPTVSVKGQAWALTRYLQERMLVQARWWEAAGNLVRLLNQSRRRRWRGN